MKKTILIAVILSTVMMILPFNNLYANDSNDDGYEIVTIEQMEYELGENSPYKGKYITYGVDSDGNYVRISIEDSNTKQGRSIIATIAVRIGGILVGHLISTVIEGIVVAATGQSGSEWVAYAIKEVLNKPYNENLSIDKNAVCSAYPPYGSGSKPYYCY